MMNRIMQIVMALAFLGQTARPVLADAIADKVQFCASCHGQAGVPQDQAVPILWGQQAGYLIKQLHDYKNGDRDSQIMSSIAESLADDDIPQIAAYLAKAQWPANSAPPISAPDAISACQACHQADLTGGAAPDGSAPRLAGQSASYLTATMTAYANGERANDATMSTVMQALQPADYKAIADYLASLP